jgi:hypothetical protein
VIPLFGRRFERQKYIYSRSKQRNCSIDINEKNSTNIPGRPVFNKIVISTGGIPPKSEGMCSNEVI